MQDETQRDDEFGTEDTGVTGDSGESAEEMEAKEDAGVATAADNAELEHTDGGSTTRDGTDAGVPMLAGDASEPVGPEDALGEGPKRGDYEKRVDGEHLESRATEDGGTPIRDEEGNIVDYTPRSELVSQTERASEQGEVAGEKGGVTTAA